MPQIISAATKKFDTKPFINNSKKSNEKFDTKSSAAKG